MGRGTYGSVYKTGSDNVNVVKKMVEEYDWVAIREILNLRYINLHHPSPGVNIEDFNYYSRSIILEYCDINLQDWLSGKKSYKERENIAKMVIGLVFSLHQIGIIHADLKLANIMLKNGRPTLIDFGFSGPDGWSFTNHTTPIYKDRFNTKSFEADIYALGIILIEILTGVLFNNIPDPIKIKKLIKLIDKKYRKVIQNMITEPEYRPNIVDIMIVFNIAPDIPKLIKYNDYEGMISNETKIWINKSVRSCNISGPHKVCDLFSLLGLFSVYEDFYTNVQIYCVALLYIYGSYFYSNVNFDGMISLCPSKFSKNEAIRQINEKIDIILRNNDFIIKFFSSIK